MPAFLCNGDKRRWAGKIGDFAREYGYPYFITTSVDAVGGVLSDLAANGAGFTGVLGGDGTLQQYITAALRRDSTTSLTIAPLGAGTMEQARKWLGWRGTPLQVARQVTRAYQKGELRIREVPVLKVEHAGTVRYGFMFLLGPFVRLLAEYDRQGRSLRQACTTAIWSSLAALTGWPKEYKRLIHPAQVAITADGDEQPNFSRPTIVIASILSRMEFDVRPFLPSGDSLEHDRFYTILSTLPPAQVVTHIPRFRRGRVPEGERLFNRPCAEMTLRTSEKLFTLDGELFDIEPGELITVTIGPTVRLVVP